MDNEIRRINLLDAFLLFTLACLICMLAIPFALLSPVPTVRVGGDMNLGNEARLEVRR